jgi:hypothetical protein
MAASTDRSPQRSGSIDRLSMVDEGSSILQMVVERTQGIPTTRARPVQLKQ